MAFLKKLGMNIEDAKPDGMQIRKALKYFDLGVKIEVTLVSKDKIRVADSSFLYSKK